MKSIECVKARIRATVARSAVPEDPVHAENTLEWLLKLNPAADEALRLAALGHDIERAVAPRPFRKQDFDDYDEYKAAHANRSATIIGEILKECEVPIEISEEARRLVGRHEHGGDERSNILKDADSLSFFQTNLPLYYSRVGWEEALRRCRWGFDRLSPGARELFRSIKHKDPALNRLLDEASQPPPDIDR